LGASLSWLACNELCVPGSAEVSIKLPVPRDQGVGLDQQFSSEGVWPEPGKPSFPVTLSEKGAIKLLSLTGQAGATYDLFPDPPDGTTVGHITRISSEGANGPAIVFSIPWDGVSPFRGLLVEHLGDENKAWWILKNTNQDSVNKVHTSQSISLIIALLSGFLGGLILNLMPCVLPVISLKIFSFIAQAGESPKRIFRHGLAFSAGIFTWFLGIGVLVIAVTLRAYNLRTYSFTPFCSITKRP
jgi:thiol:disulfide interchange protein DsbD